MAQNLYQHNQAFPDQLLATNTALLQSFDATNQDLYNIQTGIEMLSIPSKSQTNQIPEAWRSYFQKMVPGTSSGGGGPHHDIMMVASDASMRSLYNQQNQGLSLSLFQNSRDAQQGGLFYTSQATSMYQQPHHLKSSRYLLPVQQLLNEICSLAGETGSFNQKLGKSKQWEEGGSSSSSWSNQQNHFQSLDILELQKIKARLFAMLEEVDRRYRRYCEQMKVLVASFEAVAGERSATVYTALASKTMSRHFRCLRDGVVRQINAVKKALGEKDSVGSVAKRGETPRLKLLDQCLRQQKVIQQAGIMESHPWRPQRGLPERSVSILRAWLFEHFLHPYPSDVDKHILARQTGLSRSQVSNWFINARVRLWKPMIEEMYMEEMKDQDNNHASPATGLRDSTNLNSNSNPNPSLDMGSGSTELHAVDEKPTPTQLHHDPGSLSSIFNSSRHRSNGTDHNGHGHNYGMMDMNFSTYNNNNNTNNQGYGSGVSLTLGLQQHSRGATNLSFSLASQNSLLYSGVTQEPIEDVPPSQFSIVDGEGQSIHFRNMVGAHLLHDLAG
ncbi:BEL1-like homeodomain 2 [Rhynchospora pubera]|uniref:BEL1-like homeodomain 2 n=1 Tax=Rhynchospora pubera TaxID=906938 RepID=A0AAV8EUD4_9POAL|nr:BEL1-like homeodomain 2 [Rhynchospora pubera]